MQLQSLEAGAGCVWTFVQLCNDKRRLVLQVPRTATICMNRLVSTEYSTLFWLAVPTNRAPVPKSGLPFIQTTSPPAAMTTATIVLTASNAFSKKVRNRKSEVAGHQWPLVDQNTRWCYCPLTKDQRCSNCQLPRTPRGCAYRFFFDSKVVDWIEVLFQSAHGVRFRVPFR